MMGITLIACLLAVTSASRARAEIINCSELCKSIVYPQSWPAECNCSSEDESLFDAKELEDNGVYFEPIDVYTLQRLSFISPPFYILNPTFKFDSAHPKVIKKRKLSNYNNHDINPALMTLSKPTAVATNKRASYLDIDVQDTPNGRSTHKEPGTNNALKLSEKDFMECINLYALVYSKTGSLAHLPKVKAKISSEKYIIDESQLLAEIRKKCSKPADVVKQSVQEIKNTWGQPKISSFESTESISLEDEAIEMPEKTLTTSVEKEVLNASTDYPSTSELSNNREEFQDKLHGDKILPEDERVVEISSAQSRNFNVDEDQLFTTQWPTALEKTSELELLQSSENYYTTQHSLFTTSQYFDSIILINDLNGTSDYNDTIVEATKEDSEHKRVNQSTESVSTKLIKEVESAEVYGYFHGTENNVPTVDISMNEIGLNRNYKVAVNKSYGKDVNQVNENASIELTKEYKTVKSHDQLDTVENFTTLVVEPIKNQYDQKYSIQSHQTENKHITPTFYDSITLKSEIYNKDQIGQNDSYDIERSSEYIDMDTAAAESVVSSIQLPLNDSKITYINTLKASNNTSKENHFYIHKNSSNQLLSLTTLDSQISKPRSAFHSNYEILKDVNTSGKQNNNLTFLDINDMNEWQGIGANLFSNYPYVHYQTTPTPTINTYSKDGINNKESPLHKPTNYDTNTSIEDIIIENDLNESSDITTSDDFDDYFISKSNGDTTVLPLIVSSLLGMGNSKTERKLIDDDDEVNLFSSEELTTKEEKQTTTPYMTVEDRTSITDDSHEGIKKITTEKSPVFTFSEQSDYYFTTEVGYKPQITKRENNYHSSETTTSMEIKSEETITQRKIYQTDTNISPQSTKAPNSTNGTEALKNQEVLKESRNDTADSGGINIFPNYGFTEKNSPDYISVSDRSPLQSTNNIAHHTVIPTENEYVKGNLFFVFDKTNIPARFLQKDNGELSIGIDGPTLCAKLNTKESLLMNMICNCLLYKNCYK